MRHLKLCLIIFVGLFLGVNINASRETASDSYVRLDIS